MCVYLLLPVCHLAIRHATTHGATWRKEHGATWRQEHLVFSPHYFPVKASRLPKQKNDEPRVDEPEATNEKQADDQSTGDHEDSDEEGVQGPPPPTEFKRLLEEWARDFEKLEAVAYHKATASEDISEVEAKRLLEAVEAATTKEQTSLGLLKTS